MFIFDYVRTMGAFISHGRTEITLNDVYERYDENRRREKGIPNTLKKERSDLGYKIALIQIEKALVDIARDRGDVPKSMSYDDAREAILDKKYPYREVLRRAEESEIAANEEFRQMEESRKASGRTLNEYRFLGLRAISSPDRVDAAFHRQLQTLNAQADAMLGSFEPSIKQIKSLNSIFKVMVASYEKLSNPIRKRDLDERLLTPYNPDASGLYLPYSFGDITYIPHKAVNVVKGRPNNVTTFRMNNSFGDMIEVTRLAEVGYGRFRQADGKMTYRDYSTMGEYEVVKNYESSVIAEKRREAIPVVKKGKIVTRGNGIGGKRPEHYWDDDLGAEVFIVYGNLRERILFDDSQDPNAKKFVSDVLLSNRNMDIAMRKNGGYLGDMVADRSRRGYTVTHDRDKLCLAKELEAIKPKHRLGDVPIQIDGQSGRVHIGGDVVNKAPKKRYDSREDR